MLAVVAFAVVPCSASAQDPAKVDAKHYKVVYEDATVRVLKLTFGPHEKSVMHEHPIGGCAIFLTDFRGKNTTSEGKVTTDTFKAGDVNCDPVKPGIQKHLPENVADKPQELIVIEQKPVAKKP